MNLDLLNIVGVKALSQPAVASGTEEGEGLLDGSLFLSMLQDASTTENLEIASPVAVEEDSILSSQTIEVPAQQENVIEEFTQEEAIQPFTPNVQEEVTISTPLTLKPVTLNNTIGEEVVESFDAPEVKQPVNMQLAFLMNDVSKDVKIAENVPQVAPKAELSKLEEEPIEEIAIKPEIKLSSKSQAPLIATQELPKAPKRLITTTKGGIESEKVADVKIDAPQNVDSIQIAMPQKIEAVMQPIAQTQNMNELNSNPTNIEFVKLVPHKVITKESSIELTSKPLLIAPNDFEKFVEPLVMSYEAAEAIVIADKPVEPIAIMPSKTLELPVSPAIKEYVPIAKQQTLEHSVPQQISVNLMKSIENGKESMTFKLQPADLGEVDIKFQTTKDGATQVSILSDKFTTFDSISRSVQQIESILHQSGFKSENLSIDVGLKEHNQQQHGKQNNEFVAFNNDEQFSAEIINFKPKHDGLLNIVI